MVPLRPQHRRLAPLALATPAALALALLAPAGRAATPRVHAIVNARIVTAPGHVVPRGTIVMRDGIIVAVGSNVAVPPDARIWNGDSLTVYPGMIDAFVMPAEPPAPAPEASANPGQARRPAPLPPAPPRGAAHELPSVRPETRMVESLPLPKDQVESLRAAGFTAVQAAPRAGILRGTSAVVGLSDATPNASLVRDDAAQVIALEPARTGYPGSLMGAVAVIRQSLLDARWYHEVQSAYRHAPVGRPRPVENVSWAALEPLVAGAQPALFVAGDMLEALRAGAIAREAGLAAAIVGGGDEYKRVKDIAALGFALIVPVNFPEAPDLSDPDNAPEVTTEELRHWDQAPGNPAALARAGASFALTANGMKDVKAFRARVAKAIGRGLAPDQALAAVTTAPAKILGLADRLGTLEPGKIANLTVTRGDLFSERGRVREVWVDGDRYESPEEAGGLAGRWALEWSGKHTPGGVTLIVATEKDTTVRLVVHGDSLTATGVRVEGKRLAFDVQRGAEPIEHFDLALDHDRLAGTLSVTAAGAHDVTGMRMPEAAGEAVAKGSGAKPDQPIETPVVMGNSEAWRAPPPAAPAVVFVHDATIWTAGPQGTIEHGDLIVRGGKIAAVGVKLAAPAGALVIDGRAKHVAPGIVDCHSHSAILGNVNECTNSVTSEVRIQDVVNSESVNIYRQLASGNTVMHLLHGSCNAIGGQCAVIKNKWGEPPDRLLFAAAPPTIKFALGENPKQSNWGAEATGRYPQSRGGVEQTIRDAFARARDYRDAWAEWRAHKRPYPPRRDLQLDALVEVLEGRRNIHCHSYRQDEILMLMRVAEEFGVKVQTFQHVLEGYKVADEMAAHGAGGSTFSDWWAYKYEVIDAIPYNGYLMWNRGVSVSYNSDSDELARRLNTEAAKAIKYGGVPPAEAIKFVTLNPAKQLKIDSRVGSLEVGKDADFAIWSGSPLSPYSLCEQTWIEGRKYFDREADLAARAALTRERDQLIAKARAAKKEGGGGGGERRGLPGYLEDADLSGNDCGGEQDHGGAFHSETLRRELQETRSGAAEGVRR